MSDRIEKIEGSTVQHGKLNDRIYLMSLSKKGFPEILQRLDELALRKGYSKIFAKVPDWAVKYFQRSGHVVEAEIPGFYDGDDAYFTGKFLEAPRETELRPQRVGEVLEAAENKPVVDGPVDPPEGFLYREAGIEDAGQMAEVYREVFATYPFPIHDPDYLKNAMAEGDTRFFGVWEADRIVALASSEMDRAHSNAEMTDFATLPDYRKNGLAVFLLQTMEDEMGKAGIKLAYTIARAYSFGMNITFAKMGYGFGGTLTNNTNIAGRIESMNVWYKDLVPA